MAHPETEQIAKPVGIDCDCGLPLIWRLGEPMCAIYGKRHRLHTLHAVDEYQRRKNSA